MISTIINAPVPPGQGNGRASWPRGLILAPTRELVQQIFDEVRLLGFRLGVSALQWVLDVVGYVRQKG